MDKNNHSIFFFHKGVILTSVMSLQTFKKMMVLWLWYSERSWKFV